MCELCQGSHRIQIQNNSVYSIHPCPKCGPLPETEKQLRRSRFKKRLDEALERQKKKEQSA